MVRTAVDASTKDPSTSELPALGSANSARTKVVSSGKAQSQTIVERCAWVKSDGEQCRRNQKPQCLPYCNQHWDMKQKQDAEDEKDRQDEEREREELQSAIEVEKKMSAVTDLFKDLTLKLNDVKKLTEADGKVLQGENMAQLKKDTKTLFDSHNTLNSALDGVYEAVTGVRRQCEHAEEHRRLKLEKRKLLEKSQEYLEEIKNLEKQRKALQKKADKLKLTEDRKFMKTGQYREFLKNQGVDLEGLDVCHIIACSHGGPDHTDNYLFALSEGFNRGISDQFDDLNFYLAGKAKALKAVEIALKVAQNTDLHKWVSARHKEKPRLFTESVHYTKGQTPKQICDSLIDRGRDLVKEMQNARPKHRYFTRSQAHEAEA